MPAASAKHATTRVPTQSIARPTTHPADPTRLASLETAAFALQWLLAVAVGAWLRLHELGDQIPISDEWHGLQAASQDSFRQLATLMTAGATSIPYNLYHRWLLGGLGWSEWTIRFPSLVAGIASVALAPALLRRPIGMRAAAITAWLLAISPFLVLYSRYARPYAPVVLCSLVVLVACRGWAGTGSRWNAAAFAAACVLAGWMHVLEVRLLVLCGGFVAAAKLLARRVPSLAVTASWRSIAVTGTAGALALSALLLPAALSTGDRLFAVLALDRPTVRVLLDALALLAGTSTRVALGAVLPLAVLGSVRLVRRDRWLAVLFAVVSIGCVVSIFAARPDDSDVAQVFARYSIPLLPIGAIVVSLGLAAVLDALGRWLPDARPATRIGVETAATWASIAALLLAGPWPHLYVGRNAFTAHKAFHASYDPAANDLALYQRYLRAMHWRAGRVNVVVPAFYRQLAKQPGDGAVIEYPVPIGDVFSFYFLRQELHGRRTLGGWLHEKQSNATRLVPGQRIAVVDDVLAALPDPGRIHFASLVPIDDPAAVRASGARYLVVHEHLLAELQGRTPAPVRSPLRDRLDAAYGAPAYQDPWIAVYDLAPRRASRGAKSSEVARAPR